jgi:hypothetical protein
MATSRRTPRKRIPNPLDDLPLLESQPTPVPGWVGKVVMYGVFIFVAWLFLAKLECGKWFGGG